MNTKKVVSIFLRRGEKVLILKRSSKVRTYKKHWTGIGGYIKFGEKALSRAKQEILEETGVEENDLKLIKRGDPFTFRDNRNRTTWKVYPFAFESKVSMVKLNWENLEYKWIKIKNFSKYGRVLYIEETLRRVTPIKAVIFDFDDTLMKTSDLYYKKTKAALIAHDISVPPRKLYNKHFGKPALKMFKCIFPNEDAEKIMKLAFGYNFNTNGRTLDGVIELFKFLKKKRVKIGLLTNGDRENLKDKLKFMKIGQYFEYIHSMEDSVYHKPHPKVFNKILAKFNIYPEEAFYVGDLIVDAQAARRAGLNFIATLTGLHSKNKFKQEKVSEQFIVKSLKEVPEILGKYL